MHIKRHGPGFDFRERHHYTEDYVRKNTKNGGTNVAELFGLEKGFVGLDFLHV